MTKVDFQLNWSSGRLYFAVVALGTHWEILWESVNKLPCTLSLFVKKICITTPMGWLKW
jgi:hypothetical protein